MCRNSSLFYCAILKNTSVILEKSEPNAPLVVWLIKMKRIFVFRAVWKGLRPTNTKY